MTGQKENKDHARQKQNNGKTSTKQDETNTDKTHRVKTYDLNFENRRGHKNKTIDDKSETRQKTTQRKIIRYNTGNNTLCANHKTPAHPGWRTHKNKNENKGKNQDRTRTHKKRQTKARQVWVWVWVMVELGLASVRVRINVRVRVRVGVGVGVGGLC